MKILRKLLVIPILAVAYLGYLGGQSVPIDDQIDIIKVLVSVSSIIMGVMGVWVSILKIELKAGAESAHSKTESDGYVEKGRNLVDPLVASAIVILVSIISMFFLYYLKSSPSYYQHIYQGVSYSAILTISFYQLVYLVKSIVPSVEFILDLRECAHINSKKRKR